MQKICCELRARSGLTIGNMKYASQQCKFAPCNFSTKGNPYTTWRSKMQMSFVVHFMYACMQLQEIVALITCHQQVDQPLDM